MRRLPVQQTAAWPNFHIECNENRSPYSQTDPPGNTATRPTSNGDVTSFTKRKSVQTWHHRNQVRCWAQCNLRDLVWILLFVCAGGSGFTAGIFFLFIQQEHTMSRRASMVGSSMANRYHYAESSLGSQFSAINIPTNATQPRSPVISIFYNAFFSSNTFGFSTADPQSIIREQLGQVIGSFASSTLPTVYYTTIGQYNDYMVDVCRSLALDCRHLQHFPVASESATLARLHEYCSKFSSHSVVYLHNKGSLHQSRSQDSWRQALTASATSVDCLQRSLRPPFKCNVCGLLFQPLPASHFPGNMWSATCKYIQELLPPDDYHTKRPAIDEWIHREQNTFLFRPESHFVGKRRYEAEHWIGSHPSLRPCDVSISPSLEIWTKPPSSENAMKLEQAPRSLLLDPRWIFYKYMYRNETLHDPKLRFRDYFFLRGIVYRWMVFYNHVADQDSWVWQWYPDGSLWRNTILKSGDPMRAIQVMVNSSGTASIRMPVQPIEQKILQAGSTALDWMKVMNSNGAIIYKPF